MNARSIILMVAAVGCTVAAGWLWIQEQGNTSVDTTVSIPSGTVPILDNAESGKAPLRGNVESRKVESPNVEQTSADPPMIENPIPATSRNSTTATGVELTVTGIKPSVGVIRVAIFAGVDGFPDHEKATKKVVVQPDGETVTTRLDIELTTFAIAVYQDADNNGTLTKGALGIPKERYGFSNNARGQFGPPTFDQAKTSLDPTLKISLR